MSAGDIRLVRSAAHWGAFWAEVKDGRVVGTRPFEHDRHPSPLLGSIPAMVHGPSRIAAPYVRKGYLDRGRRSDRRGRGTEPFVRVTWETALDLLADALRDVRATHGNEAIFAGSYGWSSAGRLHHARTQLHRFINLFGGATQQVTTYSTAAGSTILPHVLGDGRAITGPVTGWDSILRDGRLFVSFGGLPEKNLQTEAGGSGDHASLASLRALAQSDIEIVCIGPLRADAPAGLAVEWLQPRPGTDTAIMLGIAHTLLAEGLHDQAFLERYTVGFERFRAYLTGDADGVAKDAAWAARIAGLDAEPIRRLARRMAAGRTMINATWSLQRADHGEQPFWMAVTLAAMLGQIGLPGGGVGFGYGSMGRMGNPRSPAPSIAMPSGRNPTGRTIPVARIADMLLEPGKTIDFDGRRVTFPDIRMIYWCGGNPFHHHQDINRLLEGWRRPDCIAVHEIGWTATARHADIVLPATTTLERNDIASSADRFLLAMHKAVEPVGEARNDHDIFADLAARLGFHDAFTEGRDEMGWLRHLYDVARQQAARHGIERPDFDTFWRDGFAEWPAPDEPFVLFADFRADPDGAPLRTPSGRIEIFSETIAGFGYDDCPGHATWIEPTEWLGATVARDYPLHLVTTQPERRLHGQLDGGPVSLAAKIAGREPVTISPVDAAARGVRDGDVVRLFNARGQCLAGAVVSDAVRPGVVVMQTGAWYDPLEPGAPGTLDVHGNPNVLTLDKGTSKLAQGPSAQTTLVEIERWTGDAPAVNVLKRPRTTAHQLGTVDG